MVRKGVLIGKKIRAHALVKDNPESMESSAHASQVLARLWPQEESAFTLIMSSKSELCHAEQAGSD